MIWAIALGIAGALLQGLELVSLRPRPFGVRQLASWESYATPSIPVGAIAILSIGVAYMLGRARPVPLLGEAGDGGRDRDHRAAPDLPGRRPLHRRRVRRDRRGVDPAGRLPRLRPERGLPGRLRPRGKSAHLDVTGRRGEAIRTALQDQLGLTVHDVQPVGLEGSGGSTPLKLTVTDEEAASGRSSRKLYAKSHVRADRWYKLGRTMLYGRLEDETPFQTVRRLVEYEDYTLRMLGDYGFPTPAPLGIVEITPEREYLIVMDFFDDAVEIGEAEVDAHVIDEGLAMIRRMWDLGLAHRDIKPANLMVQRGELKLIDVFFVQVRPSPWRQAVDLANMMLVLALRIGRAAPSTTPPCGTSRPTSSPRRSPRPAASRARRSCAST